MCDTVLTEKASWVHRTLVIPLIKMQVPVKKTVRSEVPSRKLKDKIISWRLARMPWIRRGITNQME
jgi:hypothetical protein